ncbi:hypothetical protein OIU76_028087 [Salix suchowensis]|nr:hypothetical protein OIU76_028087 [Salix suchowensis]
MVGKWVLTKRDNSRRIIVHTKKESIFIFFTKPSVSWPSDQPHQTALAKEKKKLEREDKEREFLEMIRPATGSSVARGGAHGGFWHWNSPVAYVFVGLALMLGLITVALIILACSYYRKSLSNSSRREAELDEKPAKQVEIQVDFEPKVVVIMAGDENPTYLAKPVSCTCNISEKV